MKKMFFALLMTSTTLLFANEQISTSQDIPLGILQSDNQESSTQSFDGLESRIHYHHHHCKHGEKKEEKLMAYGSFYTEEGITTSPGFPAILPGSPIIFNRTSVSTSQVFLAPGGTIIIEQPGDYLVKFGAAVTSFTLGSFPISLALNGVFPQPGSKISSTSIFDQFSGSTIIHVPTAPAVLTVVNSGSENIILGSPTPGDISAFITLYQLHK